MKILKILSILIIIISVVSCVVTNVHPTSYPVDKSGIEEDSGIMFGAIDPTDMPVGGTWAAVRAAIDQNFDNVNGTLDSIETTLTEYSDSITNYSSDIQLRLLISDTTSMLGNYTRNGELASALASYVAVTDTATMLANYALTSELGDAGTSIGDVRDEIADSLNVLRPLYVAVADTAAMLDTYAKLTDLSEGGIGIGAVQDEIADSLNVLRPLVVMVADTASMLTNYALLSEVGTGDVVIGDVRDEIADSLNVLRPLYVAVADTASMLTNYLLASEFAVLETRTDSIIGVLADSVNIETLLQIDLSADTLADLSEVRLRLAVADTASMLTNYALLSEVAEASIDSLILNGGSLTLTGDDKLTFETNGIASYSLPAGGGNLTIMSQVQDWINDSLDVIRPLYVEVADTSTMLSNYLLDSETAAAVTGFTPAGGSLTLSGADALTITTSAETSVTLPTSGTLATTTQLIDTILLRSEAVFVFGAGSGAAGDSVIFAKGAKCFGSFNTYRDSLYVSDFNVLYITAGDSLNFNCYYGNRMTGVATDSLFNAVTPVGEDQNTLTPNNRKIPPYTDVWLELKADQLTGLRPKQFEIQLNGYRIKAY